MSPRFFIDRPVFSWVIALAIVFAGFLALRSLPIEQYPTIAPPSRDCAPPRPTWRSAAPSWPRCG